MKFPRNARILRGQLDAAPFAAVFFLLIIFALLTSLIYTPGVHIELPAAPAANVAGVEGPTVAVAVDKHGRYYYQNQPISESDLKRDLELVVKKASQPLTLILVADKDATYDVISHLTSLAQSKGIKGVLWQTLPRPTNTNNSTVVP